MKSGAIGVIKRLAELLKKVYGSLSRRQRQFRLFLTRRLMPGVLISTRNKWRDIATFVETDSPTIVDGGAAIESEDSVGSFHTHLRDPTIVAFEPRPDAAATLRDRYGDEVVTVYQVALGSENADIEFNVSGGASSALDPRAQESKPRDEIEVQEKIAVEQVQLDEFLDVSPEVLKLDLQGYELEALRGSVGLLEDVDVILTEVNFRRLYEETATFADIDQFLTEHDFEIFNLYDVETWSNGELAWADAMYLHEDIDRGDGR